MKYRIEMTLFFTDKQLCDDVYSELMEIINDDKVVSINKGKSSEELSKISKHNCYHDEGKSCQLVEELHK